MKKLTLAVDLQLGLDAVTQTFAFLARRGAGKTYGATKLAEEMLDADAQVVAIDPIGCWWALRVPEGKGKGCDIVVFGGLHGDLPLTPEAGGLVAEVIVERSISAVLDVSMMRKGDRKRFAAEFAERFFELKKSRKSPVHVFLEEAQVFVPQRVMPDEARMLGAFEDLVKLGRNFGIGCTLISQRPQAVNKDVLNQTECLVVLQTNGAQERKALKDWIVDAGMNVGAELVDSLPGLQRGEAWVWSPSWLKTTRRVHIAKKRTLNASATPEQGVELEARPLAPVDVEQLRAAMAATVAKAAAADPKALQKRVAELERELSKRPTATVEVKTVEKPVITDEQVKLIDSTVRFLGKAMTELFDVLAAIRPAWDEVKQARQGGFAAPKTAGPRPPPPKIPTALLPRNPQLSDSSLGRGERSMLEALAARHPTPLTRNQVALLSGYTASGGTFAKYLSTLKALGFVDVRGDELQATPAGIAAAGEVPPVGDVVAMWRGKLGGGEQKLFDELVGAFPAGLTRAELGERTGYEASGGTFAKYLSTLKSIGVVEVSGSTVTASGDLFTGGAR